MIQIQKIRENAKQKKKKETQPNSVAERDD